MNIRIIVVSVAIVFCCGTVCAQGFTQPSFVIDQGGGRAEGGSFKVDLSIGQPLVLDGSSRDFDLKGGFIPLLGAFAGATISSTIALADGWNIVSVPLAVGDYAKRALFPTASSEAFAFDNRYTGYTVLENGRGYWIKFSGRQSVAMEGIAREKDTLEVTTGWNLVGSLSVPMPAANITSIPRGTTTSAFFWFDQGYKTSESLEPGRGYWVKVSQTGELVLDASLASPPRNSIRIERTEELPPQPPEEGTFFLSGIPREHSLAQNYPNPFNPQTRIEYTLPTGEWVSIIVYNILGQEVSRLANGFQEAGYKAIYFDGGNLSSGVYTYRLTAGTYSQVRRMLLIR